ncbi:MAG: ATP-dependent helicase [Oscillospiraceae bacterium]|nr:ATP-dependent helicase [Oscillospiraceae bacterium]
MPFSIPDYLYETHNIQLHTQQKEALEAVSGPVLLLAVPGAGKTTVMVARIAHMIANLNIPPEKILTITFSKAGAADMQRRYEQLFGALGWATPQFSTIHSFCYRVLRAYCRQSGGELPELLENRSGPQGRGTILRELYQRINHDFLSEDLEEELTSHLSLIKNSMLTKEEVAELDTEIRNLWQLYEAFCAYKRERNLMDFDDMLGYAYTALRRWPQLLDAFRRRYPYLCVDEAQDTSRLQHEIIRLLAAPQNNLFMVGDEDQSIYRFRGAHPQTLLDFPKLYPGARILKMEENFRSSRTIVERCAAFIAQNRERYEKNMHTSAPAGLPIETPKLHDLCDEYQLVVNTIHQSEGSCAVIYRNNFSAIPLVDLLERQGVDFYIRDHKAAFRSHYTIGDVLSFLDLSRDPSNLQAFSRIFYKTGCFLRRSYIKNMDTSPLLAGESWFDRILERVGEESSERSQERSSSRVSYIASLIGALYSMKPRKAIETILGPIGYLDFLEYACGNAFASQAQKLSALQRLAERVNTVDELLDRMEEMDSIINQHSQNKGCALTLTTAHAAKGLEFDTVILLDAVDDIFPAHTAIEHEKEDRIDDMEEEARLFYVACTRARKRLIIPQSDFCGDSPIAPSRFIARLLYDPVKAAKDGGSGGLYPGMKLLHPSFGEGQVMSLDRPGGKAVCFFQKAGTRTMSIEFLLEKCRKP